MKKIAFLTFVVFTLFVLSEMILAETDPEYDKALTYYNSGKYKEAIMLLKEYVEKKPEPAAYYRIGYALYKLKKFDEADEYFKMAYLIDPQFSPVKYGLPEYPEQKIEKPIEPSPKQVPVKKKAHIAKSKEKQPEVKAEPVPEKQSSQETQQQKTKEPAVPLEEKSPSPEPQQIKPQQMMQPPAGSPAMPVPGKGIRGIPPVVPTGLLAGFGIMLIILEIALYIYFCLCLFFIAKKLDVPAPWIAWIPLIQLWTVVSSANKPWWWVLLLLVPIVNIIVGIYLWVCITENLGRNKWLGLLMLVPIVNFVFLGILAFSKTEQTSYTGMGTTTA
ncbi:MAG TPA: DUF5684 domain-containing protein [Thermodesulfovibrionales bacterium]|nr:DUF5684 domain-containing protein [Thermodesulfovibrionales bacterium]